MWDGAESSVVDGGDKVVAGALPKVSWVAVGMGRINKRATNGGGNWLTRNSHQYPRRGLKAAMAHRTVVE